MTIIVEVDPIGIFDELLHKFAVKFDLILVKKIFYVNWYIAETFDIFEHFLRKYDKITAGNFPDVANLGVWGNLTGDNKPPTILGAIAVTMAATTTPPVPTADQQEELTNGRRLS
jgi:hypothetical protein